MWDLAKHGFVIRLWGESHFYLNANEKDGVVDQCARGIWGSHKRTSRQCWNYHQTWMPTNPPKHADCFGQMLGSSEWLPSQLVRFITNQINTSYFLPQIYIWKQFWKLLIRQWLRSTDFMLWLSQENWKRAKNWLALHYIKIPLTTFASRRFWSTFTLKSVTGVKDLVTSLRKSFPFRFLH